MARVLIIEDDPDIALSLRVALEKEGEFSVEIAADGAGGLRSAQDPVPDVVLLDLTLPDLDGIEVCRRLRANPATAATPLIMLTARVEERDRVRGLDLGADDYVTKPFSLREVVARVRALLRRTGSPDDGLAVLRAGGLELDPERRRVMAAEREVTLTRKEFDLLAELMRNRGRVLSRARLLENVWRYDHPGTTRTVDVHVRQLRKKLGPPCDEQIETVVGVGYRLRGTS